MCFLLLTLIPSHRAMKKKGKKGSVPPIDSEEPQEPQKRGRPRTETILEASSATPAVDQDQSVDQAADPALAPNDSTTPEAEGFLAPCESSLSDDAEEHEVEPAPL